MVETHGPHAGATVSAAAMCFTVANDPKVWCGVAYKEAPLEVVDARPPNYEKIVAVFPGAAGRGVIFAYGGKIYAPGGTKVTVELDAHERVHVARQVADPDAWWDRYLRDLDFRLGEERLAHRAEYRRYCARHIDAVKRHRALVEIAGKLASPLYGPMVTRHQAEIEIQ